MVEIPEKSLLIEVVTLLLCAMSLFVVARRLRMRKANQMKIQVYHIQVSKDKLRAMPKSERGFLLSLGYSANQVSMLQKLMMFSSNKLPPTEPEQMLSAVQTLPGRTGE